MTIARYFTKTPCSYFILKEEKGLVPGTGFAPGFDFTYNENMTLHEAAVQYLIYLYARRGYTLIYRRAAAAMDHLILCTGDLPLAQVHEKHFLHYFTVVVRDQAHVSLVDTRVRSQVSQSFWRWMALNKLVH